MSKRNYSFHPAVKMVLVLAAAFSMQCGGHDHTACTMEFRTIGLQVNNGLLDKQYTLRLATGDTFYYAYDSLFPAYYTVMTDEAQSWLQGKVEDFRFEGWRNDSLVVTANYRIGADVCHIFKESGPSQWPQ